MASGVLAGSGGPAVGKARLSLLGPRLADVLLASTRGAPLLLATSGTPW
jgi:hypothetical protein